MASCTQPQGHCPFCGATPCVGEGCPQNWLCVSCGVNVQIAPWAECAECRAITERMIREDYHEFGEGYDPLDDESWMEEVP